jgi:Cysteine-rich secretory protein family
MAVAAAFLISLISCGDGGDQPEQTQPIRERAAEVLGRLGSAIRQLAGQPEEELAPEKPIVLADTQRGSLPPCRGMNTRGAALGPGRTSLVIKCLVDGVRPRALRANGKLVGAASNHGRRMVAVGFFSHVDPRTGTQVSQRVKSSGYLQGASQGWAVGENLAWGRGAASTPASLVRAWLNSPGHRRNIMDRRWRETGVSTTLGTPEGASGVTVVQVFGRRY